MSGEHPSVKELIRSRLQGHTDDYQLAVSVEGGGMRGVVSGAMLIALQELGIDKVVDQFYGTSSGGINLAYYASGASWDGLAIYADHLTTHFVRPLHMRFNKPMLDMNYVFQEVLVDRVPLSTTNVRDSVLDVRIVLANVDSGRPEIIRLREHADRLHDYLCAGSWLPVLAGAPYVIDGTRYLDGGILYPDPSYAARSEGATHILALNTRPFGPKKRAGSTRQVLRLLLNRWQPGVGDTYVAARREWDDIRASLPPEVEGLYDSCRMVRLQPLADSHKVQRLTMDRYELLVGARAGYESTMRYLGKTSSRSFFSVTTLNKD